jgi:hypothetical protein
MPPMGAQMTPQQMAQFASMAGTVPFRLLAVDTRLLPCLDDDDVCVCLCF